MIEPPEPGIPQHAAIIFDVRYTTREDGAKTAYGVMGKGPLLLFPPGIMSLLEWASDSPGAPEFFGALAEHRTVITYDRHGCGLSDRDRTDFTLEDDIQDMEAVLRMLGDKRIDVVTASQGAAFAVTLAVRRPDMVRRMVLCECTLGQHSPRYDAMLKLLETDREGWIQALTGLGFPSGADESSVQSLARYLRSAASLEVLLGLQAMSVPVEHLLRSIRAPTLVLHRRNDALISFEKHAKVFASQIPNARLVPLMGDQHIPWAGDWRSMANKIIEFLVEGEGPGDFALEATQANNLSRRELEVLVLLATGKTNQQIADELVISLNTVRKHVSNVLDKTGASNRAQAAVYAKEHSLV
jgi:pimeloyl-ACP methyl ester carboxylesterase/DNA-binding CsgD family transcriptional regulator